MRRYETTFILTPDLEEVELEKNIERYTNIITGRGGTLEKEGRWGLRRLAYSIKKKTQGYYVHLVHESGQDVPHELERQFLLNENCLRYLTVLAEKPVADSKVDAKQAENEAVASADTAGPADKPVTQASGAEGAAVDDAKPEEPSTRENRPVTNEEESGA